MEAMKGFGFALEQHLIEDIANTMGYLDLPRSERYRNLVILGLDEYAISGSELRRKRFPINDKKLIPFTVMLPDALNKEIERVKKKRKQIKRLAIRYIVLLGFEKFKRDNPHPVKEIDLDKKVYKTVEPVEDEIDYSKLTTTNPFEFGGTLIASDPKLIPVEDIEQPVSNDMNRDDKIKMFISLIKEFDLKVTIESSDWKMKNK